MGRNWFACHILGAIRKWCGDIILLMTGFFLLVFQSPPIRPLVFADSASAIHIVMHLESEIRRYPVHKARDLCDFQYMSV